MSWKMYRWCQKHADNGVGTTMYDVLHIYIGGVQKKSDLRQPQPSYNIFVQKQDEIIINVSSAV